MRSGSRITVLALAALLALPTLALSKDHDRGGGRSDRRSSGSVQSRGDRHEGGQRSRAVWSGGRSQDRRFAGNIDVQRERGSRWREGASRERSSSVRDWANNRMSRERTWSRSGGDRGFRTPSPGRIDRGDRGFRTPSSGRVERGDRVFRTPSPGRIDRGGRDVERRIARGDGDRRYSRRDGGYGRNGDARYRDGGSARFKPSGPIIQRGGGGGHRGGGGGYRARHYYTNQFYRPSYIARSGFFLGLSIGAFPAYGYRYWDPYCGLYFSSLDPYYGHCHGIHPDAILVIDYRSRAPIATCIYDGGAWVVDDCAYDDYGYDEPPYDDRVYEDGRYEDEDVYYEH